MFQKVLIANRGEIAVRICRTLDTMGIESAAVFSDDDRGSMHVDVATEAHSLGGGGVADTYVDVDKILDAVRRSGADAVHPGYGFLSENANFARRLEALGVVFIGPRPDHLTSFGLKHEARNLASAAGVALLPGSGVLSSLSDGLREAEAIGYPVMLKSSAGGGGIGMERCENQAELRACFDTVERLANGAFGDSRLFVERCVANPRHVEVQAFGDGEGGIVILGDRDCSLQRRHQKVVEECPAPNVPKRVRKRMHEDAVALLSSVSYRSAGTVEFLYDPARQEATFLEVNTRLQVEHGVTELVYGVDLVQWMIELAANEFSPIETVRSALKPTGCAIQARVCAEDPMHDFRPTPGLLSVVSFPEVPNVRIDTWLRSGTDVSPRYDSLVAKVMAYGQTREEARHRIQSALEDSVLHGVETNREYLLQAIASDAFIRESHDTTTLGSVDYRPHTIEVVVPGAQTTIQQWPGRLGFWNVGVPPSGPMDDLSFRFGNRCLGNTEGASGLEVTVTGPTLYFHSSTTILIAGVAEINLQRDGIEQRQKPWQPLAVERGDVLSIGDITDGMRAYVLFAGGLEIPDVMESAATFTLGGIGGLNGRALMVGDVVRLSTHAHKERANTSALADFSVPDLQARFVLRITMGPHCTEDFLTQLDLQEFLDAEWTVHYHSSRTGVRLIGPRPSWSRLDGGDAGLHPSNVHDNAYAFGAIDFTGDMPVILGPDGPSLGGFVCPAAVIEADRWKLGQLKGGDTIEFVAVTEAEAKQASIERNDAIAACSTRAFSPPTVFRRGVEDPILYVADDICVRRAAQDSLLVEFGPNVLDIGLRLRVDRLEEGIVSERIPGVLETTAGIRSLLIRFDERRWSSRELTRELQPHFDRAREPESSRTSRVINLPLSWDDPACREAIERYMQSVRANAPWCPDNIEFIRRINGLPSRDAVQDIVFDAEYLVMGLGDVYLGAPVATTVDPRHRLVTTKYNPARIWTAENSVGIGGAYLCIYGMEGPGGYQFVGRTLQVWNSYLRGEAFDKHWLLRPFDQIRFFEVDAKELLEIREAFPVGAHPIEIEESSFDFDRHVAFLNDKVDEIAEFENRRRTAFAAELSDWRDRGLLTFETGDEGGFVSSPMDVDGEAFVASPLAGSIWSVHVQDGQLVEVGDVLFVVESMKTEFEVTAPATGVVGEVLVSKGEAVQAGQALAAAQ
ncbi:MAG: urea carboxylase [Gammaproteobacteria bacterium]|nr:urea carboxylase [Gammaproteobacteria bacterium]